MKFIFKYPVISIILFSLLSYFSHLALLPISIMEARNFLVAREMLTDGNWLLTTMNGIPRYEKPPLPAWFSTLFVSEDTQSLFWFRLPTSIISSIGLIVFYFIVKCLSNKKELSLIATLILGSSFYYIVIQFEAPSDMYTHVFMAFGILFLIRLFKNSKYTFQDFILASFGISASILSKGPIGIYALLIPFILAYTISFKISKKNVFLFIGVIAFSTLVGGSWFAYVRWADPDVFIEIVSKESENWTNYNVKPFYFYWNFFLQTGIWSIPALLGILLPILRKRLLKDKIYLFSFLWTIFTLVLLSIVPEKKPRYLMPILFPLAISSAFFIKQLWTENKAYFLGKYAMIVHFLLISCFCISTAFVPFFIKNSSTSFIFWYIILLLACICLGYFIFYNYKKQNLTNLIFSNVLVILIATSIGKYGLSYILNESNYLSVEDASNLVENKKIFHFDEIRPEVIWELNSKTIEFSTDKIDDYVNFFVLVNENQYANFLDILPENFKIEEDYVFERNYILNRRNIRKQNEFLFHLYLISKN